MSGKYKVGEDELPHFVTFTVTDWIDVFSIDVYKDLFLRVCSFA
jgi:hypothetical protein